MHPSRRHRFDPLGSTHATLQSEKAFIELLRNKTTRYGDPRLIEASRRGWFARNDDDATVFTFLNLMINRAVSGDAEAYELWVNLLRTGTTVRLAGPVLTMERIANHHDILLAWFGNNPHNFFAYHVVTLSKYHANLRYYEQELASTYDSVIRAFNLVLQKLNTMGYYPLTNDAYERVIANLFRCTMPYGRDTFTKARFVHNSVTLQIAREYTKYLLRGGVPLEDIWRAVQRELGGQGEFLTIFKQYVYDPLKEATRWRPKF